MRDYSGYIIAVLFVLFLAIVAVYDAALRGVIETNRALELNLTRLRARGEQALLPECVSPEVPAPKPTDREVVTPTFGDGSTVRYR